MPAGRPVKNRLVPPAAAEPPPSAGADNEPEDPNEEKSIAEIQQMLEDCKLDGAKVRIYRIQDNGVPAYCDVIPVAQFDFDAVKTQFGGGKYQIQLLDNRSKFVSARTFTIDPRFKGKLDGPQDPPRAADAGGLSSRDIIAMQSESTKLLMTLMMENSKAQAQILSAAIGARPQGGNGLEIKDVIALLPFLVGKEKADRMGPREMLEFFKEVKEMTGEEGKGDSPGILDKLADNLPGILARFGVGGVALPPEAAAAAAAEPAPAPAADGQIPRPRAAAPARALPAPAEETDIQRVLRLAIAAARRGAEVELYADLVADQLDEGTAAQLQNVLRQDDWFKLLFPGLPETAPVRPWLTRLRDMLIEDFTAPADGESPKPAPGGSDPAEIQPEAGAAGAGEH